MRVGHVEPLPAGGGLALLERTLAREAHVLLRDPSNLPTHVRNVVWLDAGGTDEGRELIDRAEQRLRDRPWLCLTNRPLMPHWRTAFAWRLPVAPVTWTDDGRRLVVGSALHHPRTGAYLGAVTAMPKRASFNCASRQGAVAWAPAGDRVAEAGEAGGVIVRAAEEDGRVRIDTGEDSIWSLAWSPDGRHLASGSSDGKVRVWRFRDLEVEDEAEVWSSSKPVLCLAWSPDGEWIAAGSWRSEYDVELEFFEGVLHIGPRTGRGGSTQPSGHWFRVESLAWSPDGTYLASGAADGTIRIWQAGECVAALRGATDDSVTNLAWSPDGRWLASSGGDTSVWDVATFAELASTGWQDRGVVHREGVLSTGWSSDHRALATGGRQRELFVCDTDTGAEILSLGGGMSGNVEHIAWSPEGRIAFVTWSLSFERGREGLWEVYALDPANGGSLGCELPVEVGKVTGLTWGAEENVLVTSEDGRTWTWRPGREEPVTPEAAIAAVEDDLEPASQLRLAWLDPDGVAIVGGAGRIAHAYCVSPTIGGVMDGNGVLRVAVLSGDGNRPIPFRFELRGFAGPS